jgi:hypothetical protein
MLSLKNEYREFWKDKENQYKFINNLAQDLGIQFPEKWYGVKIEEVNSR